MPPTLVAYVGIRIAEQVRDYLKDGVVTNAVNMAHKGTYSELQSIAPGATWRESWWVKPSGFEAAAATVR